MIASGDSSRSLVSSFMHIHPSQYQVTHSFFPNPRQTQQHPTRKKNRTAQHRRGEERNRERHTDHNQHRNSNSSRSPGTSRLTPLVPGPRTYRPAGDSCNMEAHPSSHKTKDVPAQTGRGRQTRERERGRGGGTDYRRLQTSTWTRDQQPAGAHDHQHSRQASLIS